MYLFLEICVAHSSKSMARNIAFLPNIAFRSRIARSIRVSFSTSLCYNYSTFMQINTTKLKFLYKK